MHYFHLICFVFVLQLSFSVDYYEILNVSRDAGIGEIRSAFKRLVLKFHPDKNKDHDESQKKFIQIVKAYEVLKTEESRKDYDLYGEKSVKDDNKANYHNWNYYYGNSGIYDEDDDITTLNSKTFRSFVLQSSDFWFVNFYSPQCSHCHHLAPAWRQLADEFSGIIKIGAVNCQENRRLCWEQNIHAYPSLVLYPENLKYDGSRKAEDLINYVLKKLPKKNIINLSRADFFYKIQSSELQRWLLVICTPKMDCISEDTIIKLNVILDDLVLVGVCDEDICSLISCDSPILYFSNIFEIMKDLNKKGKTVNELDFKEIVKSVFNLLPEVEELTTEQYMEIRRDLQDKKSKPWLIQFTNGEVSATHNDLKRLNLNMPEVHIGHFNCRQDPSVCKSLHIFKYPTFLIFKPGDIFEFYHGHITENNVRIFVREALFSHVYTLSPESFPNIKREKWLIDFFAPWCPPCMRFLPEFRKSSQTSSYLVNFGTVDCSIHNQLCRSNNIRYYPTTIFYMNNMHHTYQGGHSHYELDEFIRSLSRNFRDEL